MSADEILFDVDDRMEKAATVLKTNLAGIRTGRANPGLVDSLRVEVYGSPTPMKQIASIGVPEPNQIVIRPFDPNTIGDIEKSLVSSELGFNPQNDGRLIRIIIPGALDRGSSQDGLANQGTLGGIKDLHSQHPP